MKTSEMTDNELDELIAVKRGWRNFTRYDEDGLTVTWITPKNKPSIFGRIPHPTTDPRLAIELLEEMFDDIVQITPTTHGYEIMLNTREDGILKFTHSNFCRAITEAYSEFSK